MKAIQVIIAFVLLGVAGTGNAWAYRGGHVGVVIGVPVGPWYYPPPYYYPPYYPPVVVQQQAPPVYVEQQQAPAAPAGAVAGAASDYWYYCAAAKGYYPYVKECRDGWQKVMPQPPGQP